jgi:hypothetical protein
MFAIVLRAIFTCADEAIVFEVISKKCRTDEEF